MQSKLETGRGLDYSVRSIVASWHVRSGVANAPGLFIGVGEVKAFCALIWRIFVFNILFHLQNLSVVSAIAHRLDLLKLDCPVACEYLLRPPSVRHTSIYGFHTSSQFATNEGRTKSFSADLSHRSIQNGHAISETLSGYVWRLEQR